MKTVETLSNSKKTLATPRIDRAYIVNILINAVIFILLYGFKVLDVTNTRWLTGSPMGGDITQHYLGWLAYRNSDWAFPLGLGQGLAGDDSFSVVFTDSIPLFAFIFKLLRGILPARFQYFGWFGLINNILMSFFATRILKRFKVNDYCGAFFSILICFNNVMLFKMFYHTALAAHFMILWAFDILLSAREKEMSIRKSILVFSVFGFLTTSIHSYLLLICGLIFLAFFVYEILKYKNYISCIVELVMYCAGALLGLWLWGAFTTGSDGTSFLEYYSFNLNSFFNPMQWGNLTLPALPTTGDCQDAESYMYLGVGLLLVALIDIVIVVRKKIRKVDLHEDRKLLISLGVMSIAALIISLSPEITFGDKLLFRYPVPDVIYKLWSVFRIVARMAWPIYYMVIIFGLILLFRYLPEKAKSIGVALVFAVQLLDICPLALSIRYTLEADANKEKVELSGPFWDEIAADDSLDKFILITAKFNDKNKTVFPVAEFAIEHDMPLNQFYFARYPYDIDTREAEALMSLESGDASAVYIFTEEDLQDPEVRAIADSSGITITETDGMYVGLFR